METRKGNCLCGAVKYEITAEPVATRVCWCRDCQHIASNGTVNIIVPSEELTITGKLSGFTKTADSGSSVLRRFCSECGSHLFANSSARPLFTVVRVGTLENPSSVKPSANIWTESAPDWACFDSSLEQAPRQPAPLQLPPQK
ncbi:GFA family protein [Cellvibrio sp.]|uniref:GFA family protein n=1 Tax=Cellvibrio sp. TaxID=1965322 RepID=UPI003F4B71D0